MARPSSRREFLGATGVLGGAWAFLGKLPRVSAEEANTGHGLTVSDARVESLAKLIEQSPREKLLEEVAHRIQNGASYREVLAALLLAGVRNVQPRPAVGFKFHAVLVVNSCHLASISGPDEDRWLPIFWALDYFKSAQAQEARESGWTMAPVDESRVPGSLHAKELFIDALDRWDVEQADVATSGLVRTTGASEIFNLFARYAARDFRSIGHKAIFLANAWRTLQVIGWEFAEPVLRSLAFALLNHEGDPNPAETDQGADRAWRAHETQLATIPKGWLDGRLDTAATRQLIDTLRSASPVDSGQAAVDLLVNGISPATVWDAVFVGSGELLMRQPGIVGLHGLTTANAMRYLWENAEGDDLRQRLLLQAASFNAHFREAAQGRGSLPDLTIDAIDPPESASPVTIDDITAEISSDRLSAASKVRAYLAADGSADEFIAASRRLIFLKGRDSHDYKFSSAVLEDYAHVSPEWRDQFLALSVFNLKGTGDKDNGLVDRTRAAFTA